MPQPDTKTSTITEPLSSYGQVIASIAGVISGLEKSSRGDLAALRRMNPDAPSAPAFWRLLTSKVPAPYHHGKDAERRWALIIQGMALMVPHHRGFDAGVGHALAAIRFSELRLAKLLNARKAQFRAQITHLARHLAARGQPIDWRRLGELILCESRNEKRAEEIRMTIARDYFATIK